MQLKVTKALNGKALGFKIRYGSLLNLFRPCLLNSSLPPFFQYENAHLCVRYLIDTELINDIV